jgi:hypothetical protein
MPAVTIPHCQVPSQLRGCRIYAAAMFRHCHDAQITSSGSCVCISLLVDRLDLGVESQKVSRSTMRMRQWGVQVRCRNIVCYPSRQFVPRRYHQVFTTFRVVIVALTKGPRALKSRGPESSCSKDEFAARLVDNVSDTIRICVSLMETYRSQNP